MSKAKPKTKKASLTRASGTSGKSRKPVDLQAVREQISNRVGGKALNMVEITIAEADKGHYGAMKYLFEMIGLYPVDDEQPGAVGDDVLAKTLLKRLGIPEDPDPKPAVTKELAVGTSEGDAVK